MLKIAPLPADSRYQAGKNNHAVQRPVREAAGSLAETGFD
jgi:hypothetical protein